MHRNGRGAPTPDVPTLVAERGGSTHSVRSHISVAIPARAPFRTYPTAAQLAVWCDERSNPLMRDDPLLDDLIGAREDREWYGNAERFCGLHINGQFKCCRLLDWQVSWRGAIQYLVHENGGSTK
jgi:hypothetical protein